MKVTLHMAISIDGFIARKDGDSDWVSNVDAALFEERCKDAGCIVMGKKTFDQFKGDLYPVSGITNIVIADHPEPEDGVFAASTPLEAISLAESKGHDKILLAGGGATNGAFLAEGYIDEIFLSVHPIVLGNGIKLFGDTSVEAKLTLIDSEKLEDGLVQLHYSVNK